MRGHPAQLPNLGFQPNDGLRRDTPPRLPTAGEAEAQEFADARSSDRALGLARLPFCLPQKY
jgi:hypothetical protein